MVARMVTVGVARGYQRIVRKAAPSISRIASTYEEVDAGADGSNLQFFVELAAKSLDALRDAGLPLVLGYFGHKAAKSTSNRRADRRAEVALALTDEEYERKAKAALYKRYQIPFSEMQAEVSRIDSDGGGGVKVTLPGWATVLGGNQLRVECWLGAGQKTLSASTEYIAGTRDRRRTRANRRVGARRRSAAVWRGQSITGCRSLPFHALRRTRSERVIPADRHDGTFSGSSPKRHRPGGPRRPCPLRARTPRSRPAPAPASADTADPPRASTRPPLHRAARPRPADPR